MVMNKVFQMSSQNYKKCGYNIELDLPTILSLITCVFSFPKRSGLLLRKEVTYFKTHVP